jgi:predicted DNA-binding WGR domain protein
MKRCFQLIAGNHYKFWTVEVIGRHYCATFGRIGTEGQTQIKTLGSEAAALEKAEEMIEQKLGKGYREAGLFPGVSAALVASLRPAQPSAPAPAPVTIPAPLPSTPGRRRIVIDKK